MENFILELEQGTHSYGFYAFNIVKTKAKELFRKNDALSCLCKSDAFLKELLNIFNKLYCCKIYPSDFFNIIQSLNIFDIDKSRLNFCAQVYDFYVKTMDENGYKIPVYKGYHVNKNLVEKNIENAILNFENYETILFEDVQSEYKYLAETIKTLVNEKGLLYNDIAIFADKSQTRQKAIDTLKTCQIPVVATIYNEDYENLKRKINLYSQMAEILKSINAEEFSSLAIKNTFVDSRAKREIKLEELDEIVKMILVETVNDNSALDRVFILNENSQKSLLEILFANINKFGDDDKESINKEFGLFKHFYELYFNDNYFEAIKLIINSKISQFETQEIKATVLKKLKSLEQLQNLYDKVLCAKPEFASFAELVQWLGEDKTQEQAVTIKSIESDIVHKKSYKFVFLTGLTENNFPGANSSYPFISAQANDIFTSALKHISPEFDWFIKTDDIFYAQKLLQIKDIIGCTKEKLIFTTHLYEAKKEVQPSIIFKLASKNPSKCKNITEKIVVNDDSKEMFKDAEQDKDIIIKTDDVLKLSPSAITTFQSCPQKYFFKHLLNLKEPSTFSASYGSIVHSVFELLNRKFLSLEKYTKETVLALGEILFNAKSEPQRALDVGFKQSDIDLITAAADLSLAEMKDNFVDAVEDFSLSGGFNNPPKSAVCEKSFSFSVPELPNVVFDGRIDAILENCDGNFSIIDYKTGHDKINSLDYAISEYGVNFLLKTGKEPANVETLQNTYDYQIPIYYLATQYATELSEYKDKIAELGLVYIRPKSKDNGCAEDLINSEKMELYKEKIVQNLKETIVDKIVNAKEFEKKKSFFCDNCSYKFLCDAEDSNDN